MKDSKVLELEQADQRSDANLGRKIIPYVVGGVLVFLLGSAGYRLRIQESKEPIAASINVKAKSKSSSKSNTVNSVGKVVSRKFSSIKLKQNKSNSGPEFNNSRVVFADELITQLFDLKLREDLSPDEFESRINRILQRLIYQGEEAIPAIQDYLKTSEDITYAERRSGDRVVDSKSLRISLYEILDQIGGFEAVEVLAEEIHSTRVPMEIAVLSEILERQSPEEFREVSLLAAKTTYLKMSEGEMEQTDTAPLFQVLGTLGNSDVAAELGELVSDTKAEWQLYATVALAEIPEGEGVSALINSPLLNDPRKKEYEVPMRMLAQLAAENSEAQQALIKQVEDGRVPDRLWPYLTGAITGTKLYRLTKPQVENLPSNLESHPHPHQIFGDKQSQTLYIVDNSGNFTNEQIEARIEVIDGLFKETDNASAVRSLQNAKEFLLTQLPHDYF